LCETKDISITLYNDLISVDIPEDTITVSLGEEALLKGNYQNIDENVTFSWFTTNNDVPKCIGCQNSEVLPLFDGYYYYSVTNSLGCVATDSVYIRVQKDRSVFSPNIISANGDGNNDNFYLFGNDLGSLGKYFRVYDRWGNLVFESTNFTLNKSEYGWDGTFLGRDVIEGVYTWVASMIYIDGFELLLHGDVTIIR
jgi:gliding motility-associated-like protein